MTFKGACHLCQHPVARLAVVDVRPYTKISHANPRIDALMVELHKLELLSYEHPEERPHKLVVFSQWVIPLDHIQHRLTEQGIPFVAMMGKTSRGQRTKVISQFTQDPTVHILLCTVGMSGLALNLQVANNIFLLEPGQRETGDRPHRPGSGHARRAIHHKGHGRGEDSRGEEVQGEDREVGVGARRGVGEKPGSQIRGTSGIFK
ncbi:hypothetical protein PG987_013823 [Apiospora arundinis]